MGYLYWSLAVCDMDLVCRNFPLRLKYIGPYCKLTALIVKA